MGKKFEKYDKWRDGISSIFNKHLKQFSWQFFFYSNKKQKIINMLVYNYVNTNDRLLGKSQNTAYKSENTYDLLEI